MGINFQFSWEISFIIWIQNNFMNNNTVIFLMKLFTDLAEPVISVIIIGFFYWVKDKKFGKYIALNVLIATCTNNIIKNIFLRRRPYFDNNQINCFKLVDSYYDAYDIAGQGFSFPSGHTINSVTTYGSFYAYFKKKGYLYLSIIFSLLVGISRIALGCHYPTDVIFSYLSGTLIIILIPHLKKHLSKKYLYFFLIVIYGLGLFFCVSIDFFTTYGLLLGFLLGDLFESRYVHFVNTKNVFQAILRVVFGVLIFYGINMLFKSVLPDYYLDDISIMAHLFRTIRYAFSTFAIIGLYPLLFKYFQ